MKLFFERWPKILVKFEAKAHPILQSNLMLQQKTLFSIEPATSISYKRRHFFGSRAFKANGKGKQHYLFKQSIIVPDPQMRLRQLGDFLTIKSQMDPKVFRQVCINLRETLQDELAFIIERQASAIASPEETEKYATAILAAFGCVILPIDFDKNRLIFCEVFSATLQHTILPSLEKYSVEDRDEKLQELRILLYRAFPETLKSCVNEPRRLSIELITINKLDNRVRDSILDTLAIYICQSPEREQILDKLFWFQNSKNEIAIKDLAERVCLYLTPLVNFIK